MEALRELFSGPSLLMAATVLFKMGLGVLLGGAVGWERELNGRPAGVRTHMLIALGVVIFGEVSKLMDPTSPARIAANIVTGIGFLGAGTILRTGPEVRGLTTAASIWAVSGVALAVSAGGPFYVVAVLGTLLTLVTLVLVNRIERKYVPNIHPQVLHVGIANQSHVLDLLESLERAGGSVSAVRVLGREGGLLLAVEVTGNKPKLMHAALGATGVSSASWSET